MDGRTDSQINICIFVTDIVFLFQFCVAIVYMSIPVFMATPCRMMQLMMPDTKTGCNFDLRIECYLDTGNIGLNSQVISSLYCFCHCW